MTAGARDDGGSSGRWPRSPSWATWSSTCGAEVPHGNVDITATAVMGDVKVYVPDGVDVELTGIAVMGDKNVRVPEAPASQPAPKVVVRATVVMGDVKFIGDSYAEPARRTLRAWITRDDRDRRAIE